MAAPAPAPKTITIQIMSSDMEVLLVRPDETQKWGLIQIRHHGADCTKDDAINLLVEFGFGNATDDIVLKTRHPEGWIFTLSCDDDPDVKDNQQWRWTDIETYTNLSDNGLVDQATLGVLGTM